MEVMQEFTKQFETFSYGILLILLWIVKPTEAKWLSFWAMEINVSDFVLKWQ